MSVSEESSATGVVSAPAPGAPAAASTLAVYIDGVEVTNCATSGSWTPRLNRPAQATITCPMDCAIGDVGSRLKIEIDGNLVFHGMILNTETDTDKDFGTTVYNAQDPMELWQWRPVRANDGDFSKPGGSGIAGKDLFADGIYAPIIMQYVLENSEGNSTAQGNAALTPPAQAEGPLFLDFGTFAGGSTDVSGAPVDWPMTIMDFFSLLVSTGTVDLIITPTDPGGGIMGTVDGYSGDYGTDLSGTVVFQYGMGAHNAAAVRWNRDMTNMVNKYWIYGGPRVKTAGDLAGDQHWCFNITGQDGGSEHGDPPGSDPFPGPPDGLAYPPGGQAVDSTNSPNFGTHSADDGWTDNPIGQRVYTSRQAYGERMKIDIFDAVDDNCIRGVGTPGREIWRYQWQVFSYFAATPREIVHVTPTRETEIGSFGIGDIIGVEATADVRGGFSGAQRVYEYTVSWDNDSVLTLSEIQTSADQE